VKNYFKNPILRAVDKFMKCFQREFRSPLKGIKLLERKMVAYL
jgi:hypothetical protein